MILFLFFCAVCAAAVDKREYRFDFSYSERAEGWFKVHKIPATWDEARVRCNLEGAVLASPINEDVAAAMIGAMKEADIECGVFTGTSAQYSKGDYHAIEGVPLERMPVQWMPSEPDNYNNDESCIVLISNGTIADVQCSEVLPYICYKKAGDIETVTECGSDLDYKLFPSNGNCYKFHGQTRNWSGAVATCASEGGYLAMPKDKVEAMHLKDLFQQNIDRIAATTTKGWLMVIFLGFSDVQNNGNWTTIHGTKLTDNYAVWKTGQPEGKNGMTACGAMFQEGLLDDYYCSYELTFVCQKVGIKVTMSQCGTTDHEYKMFPSTGNCYKFHTQARNWTSAFRACSAEGGYLAIPNDAKEAIHLKDLFKQNLDRTAATTYKDVMFLGFSDIEKNGVWSTIHGSRLEEIYNVWKKGQPEGQNGSTACGAMDQEGLLDDYFCNKPALFVCEKNATSLL